MAPNREFPCDLPVPSRGDKFCCRCYETVGRQRPGLLDHPLLGRDIGDTADKQVSGLLVQFLSRLIFQYPLVLLVDQDIFFGRRLDGKHGDVGVIDAE